MGYKRKCIYYELTAITDGKITKFKAKRTEKKKNIRDRPSLINIIVNVREVVCFTVYRNSFD